MVKHIQPLSMLNLLNVKRKMETYMQQQRNKKIRTKSWLIYIVLRLHFYAIHSILRSNRPFHHINSSFAEAISHSVEGDSRLLFSYFEYYPSGLWFVHATHFWMDQLFKFILWAWLIDMSSPLPQHAHTNTKTHINGTITGTTRTYSFSVKFKESKRSIWHDIISQFGWSYIH